MIVQFFLPNGSRVIFYDTATRKYRGVLLPGSMVQESKSESGVITVQQFESPFFRIPPVRPSIKNVRWRRLGSEAMCVGYACAMQKIFVTLCVSRKYKFHDNDKLYFISFTTALDRYFYKRRI